ncbi:protein S100-A13-like [Meriones unguiculatus]|uniref:protein S100-A13-like n=1 Tax=Meriones unguiculatus TaxID=10047 RepID=UPI00293F56B6|nr:protein S100-A13-like [Meriones unguiculatus]
MASEPLTEREAAIETIINKFRIIGVVEELAPRLSFNAFKKLVIQQLLHLFKDVGSLDEKMKSLDVNQDLELNFNEYWRLIGELTP